MPSEYITKEVFEFVIYKNEVNKNGNADTNRKLLKRNR